MVMDNTQYFTATDNDFLSFRLPAVLRVFAQSEKEYECRMLQG